jgi:S-adenosylmethionine decarboxylase
LECKHCVAELFNANSEKLNDEAFVREALIDAAEAANATLLNISTHAFSPQGVTGFALLAESHISIHTWPEYNFASVDAFTCGEVTKPDAACMYLARVFESKGHTLNTIERVTPKIFSKSNL